MMENFLITLIGVSVLSVLLAGAAMWAVRAVKTLLGSGRTQERSEPTQLDLDVGPDGSDVHEHPRAA
jgi:hypothetical protein